MADTCPHCGDDKHSELDPLTLAYFCNVCASVWRRRPGRLVPKVTGARTDRPPLDFNVSELPPAGAGRKRRT